MNGKSEKARPDYQKIAAAALLKGEYRARVSGNSMFPCLRSGDEVVIEAGGQYRCGDILAFPAENGVVAHRYLGELGGRLILKGDARLYVDPALSEDEVSGVVRFVIRHKMRVAIDSTFFFISGKFLSDIYWKIYQWLRR